MKTTLLFLLLPWFAFSQKIIAHFNGDNIGDQLGRNVTMSGDGKRLVIGAPFSDERGSKSGHVRVYQQTDNDWVQIGGDILGETQGDNMGEIVALSKDGNTLAVGVPLSTPSGYFNIYVYSGGDWKLIATIQPNDDPAAKRQFVRSVSLSADGSFIALGFDKSTNQSRVQVYHKNDSTWEKFGQQLEGGEYMDSFGESIDLSDDGSIIAIGASGKDADGKKNSGQVKVFSRQGQEWILLGEPMNGTSALEYFGHRVCLSADGKVVAVTASSQDLSSKVTGYACIFRYDGGKWNKVGNPIKPKKNVIFAGQSLALSDDGNIVAFSTPFYGLSKPGDVAVYTNINNTWKLHTLFDKEISPEKTDSGNNSTGWAISVSGDGTRLLVGYPHNDIAGDMCGEAVVYELKY